MKIALTEWRDNMKLIRRGTFETNSSSTHSITMCTESDFDKWKNGEMYWNRWNEELVPKEEVEKLEDEYGDKIYYTYEEFNSYDYLEYETFEDHFNGVAAFGYYGYDG